MILSLHCFINKSISQQKCSFIKLKLHKVFILIFVQKSKGKTEYTIKSSLYIYAQRYKTLKQYTQIYD